MPDDLEIAEQEQEETENLEFDAFKAEAEGKEHPEEVVEEVVEKTDPEKAEKPEEKKEEEEPETTAKDRIEARAKELEEIASPAAKDSPPSEAVAEPGGDSRLPPPASVPSVPGERKLTKETIAGYLSSVPDDQIPDGPLIIGDHEINLKEFAEDFPDQWAAVKVLANVIAKETVESALKDSGFASQDSMQKRMAEYETSLAVEAWWNEVRDTHPDAKRVSKSKDFTKWLDEQPEMVQRMAGPDAGPSDAILVLDYYKEGQAKAKTKDHDDKQAKAKKAKDELHGSTIREKPSQASQKEQEEIDENAAFEAEAKRA